MVLKQISKKQNKRKIYPTLFTVFPSMTFVNIMICSMCSCQTMNQKSATVFCLGPREIEKKWGENEILMFNVPSFVGFFFLEMNHKIHKQKFMKLPCVAM